MRRTTKADRLGKLKRERERAGSVARAPMFRPDEFIVACALAFASWGAHAQEAAGSAAPSVEVKGKQKAAVVAAHDAAAPAAPVLDAISVRAARPSLYAVPDVNVGALGAKDPKDLPMSVASYSSELIEAQRARTLMDVLENDPSVQNSAVGGAMDNIGIRGFPVDWANTMRRDGMPVAPYYDLPLENVERVDVLKGPSGFLYGVNSPGGTVDYVLKRPTRDRFATVTSEVRSHDGYYTALDAGGPLGDGRQLGYRFDLAGEKVGDFGHAGDLRRTFASGALDWAVTPRALLRFDFDYQNKRLAAQPVIGTQPDGSLPPQFDPRTLLGQPWLQYRTNTFNVGGRFDFKLTDTWTFTTQVAQSYNNRDAAFPDIYSVAANGDILSGDIYLSPDQSFRVLSTNTFVSGKFDTGPLAHQLVAGVSTRNYEARQGGFGVMPITVGNLFAPAYSPAQSTAFPAKTVEKNFQPSVFVSDLIGIGSHWSVMLGVRHVNYRDDSYAPSGSDTHYNASVNVPSAGVIFKPLPSLSTYASYSEGFEQGGVAPFNALNAGQSLAPVKSKQYEAGVKADIASRLTVDAAVFRIEKTLQYVNTANYYVQAGTQRHTGIELTANGRLTPRLSIVAGAAYLHTAQEDTGDPATNGKRAANVPAFQASAFLDYRIAAIHGLNVDAGIYYVGARPLDASNSVSLPGYVRFDAGARYQTRIGGHTTIFRAGVQNVTDKRYWAAANYNAVWPGQPRTFFLSAQVDL